MTPAPLQGSLTHPAAHCSLQAAGGSLEEKNALSPRRKIDFGAKNEILSVLPVNLYPFLPQEKGAWGREKNTVSCRKFVIKASRSMIMAFALVFVIFAKATVVGFPQIYLYTSAVSGV